MPKQNNYIIPLAPVVGHIIPWWEKYAKKYDVVFLERLQKLNMVKNHKMARRILDSGWGTFGTMLDYKTMTVEVPAKNTTINCSRCGNVVPKTLAVRATDVMCAAWCWTEITMQASIF